MYDQYFRRLKPVIIVAFSILSATAYADITYDTCKKTLATDPCNIYCSAYTLGFENGIVQVSV